MGLVSCPDCGKRVSDRAQACPNCGSPISDVRDVLIQKESDRVVEAKRRLEEQATEREHQAKAKRVKQIEERQIKLDEIARYEKGLAEIRTLRSKGNLIPARLLRNSVQFAQILAWLLLVSGVTVGLIGMANSQSIPDPALLATIAIFGIVMGVFQLLFLRHTFMWKRMNLIMYLMSAVLVAIRLSKATPVLGIPFVISCISVVIGANEKTKGYKVWTIMDSKGIVEEVRKESNQRQESHLDSPSSYSVDQAFSFACEACGQQICHSRILKSGDQLFCKHCGSAEIVPDDSKIASIAAFKEYLSIQTKVTR